MNIKFIKTLLEIREFSKNSHVRCNDYGYGYNGLVIKNSINAKEWILYSESRFILTQYFGYQFEFNDWLNHQSQNLEFENEMQRYLNLKAFT